MEGRENEDTGNFRRNGTDGDCLFYGTHNGNDGGRYRPGADTRDYIQQYTDSRPKRLSFRQTTVGKSCDGIAAYGAFFRWCV